jgi:DNA-directed RNA polymerase alpha subunit
VTELNPLYHLRLSVRVRNNLESYGIWTVGDLIEHSARELVCNRGFGAGALLEVRLALGEYGLGLRGDTQVEYFASEAAALER